MSRWVSRPTSARETPRRVGDGIECLHGRGIDAVFDAAPSAASLDELLRDARANVARTAEQVTRLMRIVRSH